MPRTFGPEQPPSVRGLAAKHAAILANALQIFVRQGYAATTLDDIAHAAGVSRQTVYNHFGHKDSLFLTVIDEALEATTAELREATEGFPGDGVGAEEYLIGLGRRMVTTFLSPRSADLRLLVQSEAPRHPKLRELYQQRSTTPVWSPLIGQLARLAHKGILDIDDPRRAAGQFVTLVTGAGWHMTDLGTFNPTAIDADELDANLVANIQLFVRAHNPTR